MGYSLKVEINAPLEKVWGAWNSQEDLERWLAPKARVEFKEGGAYEFFWGKDHERDSTLGCTLISIEPTKKIKFQWQGPAVFLHLFKPPVGLPTTVEARFEKTASGAKITIEQTETRDIPLWDAYDRWMSQAWSVALDSLRRYCEGISVEKMR